MSREFIRVIAICPFRYNDRILVKQGFDVKKEKRYYRPLGGGVEFGESTVDTIQREIQEEIEQSIEHIRLLGVLENIFRLDGQLGHQIVYVYDARFVDRSIYSASVINGQEDFGERFEARWRHLDSFDEHHRLVPTGLFELLMNEG